MSGEPVKKTKLTDEERVARINVSKKAYEAITLAYGGSIT